MESSPGPASEHDVEVLLAEYAALRAEIERRTTLQWNAFALQFASAGAIASVAISTAGNLALLLVIPMSSYMLGSRYVLHDFHIKRIRRYLREHHGLRTRLGWERWSREQPSPAGGGLGWRFTHPTRMAFEGIAALALLVMVAAAVISWLRHSPNWAVIVGGCAGWLVGLGATVALHRMFERAGRN